MSFDDYELSKYAVHFLLPILIGIGHDRNTSRVDLVCFSYKTPSKVATFIIDHNFEFEVEILDLKGRVRLRVENLIEKAKDDLKKMKRLVKSSSLATTMQREFAIITIQSR